MKPKFEDKHSWSEYTKRNSIEFDSETLSDNYHRSLKHHHHHEKNELEDYATQKKALLDTIDQQDYEKKEKATKKSHKKHKKNLKLLRDSSGIRESTIHGMMIDAGSTGSRLHVYEFEPRVLNSVEEIELVVAGEELTFPGSENRWTDRLSPGISEFADYPDNELLPALETYLSPLIDFAKQVLKNKENEFGSFPIYLKATAGMRILRKDDRSRIMNAIQTLFHNKTFCPFEFENERARVISGEEEAVYGWTAVNFLMKSLLANTEGSGTVMNPKLTYGALDMGGASTQISFYEPIEDGDVMSNLFKLQIGAAKHWNLYTHSYLHFGVNEAFNRCSARLIQQTANNKNEINYDLAVQHPCLPGGSSYLFKSEIYFDENGHEIYKDKDDNGNVRYYASYLRNDNTTGNYDECMVHTQRLLRKDSNSWCDFSHRKDCSFAGVYQPPLPTTQSSSFGEFLAFSNYYHVWDFLNLQSRSSIRQLQERTQFICNMSLDELQAYNAQRDSPFDENDDLLKICFRSSYALNMLHEGYGFSLDDSVIATNVIHGHKVGWALGSMLYEINTLPWRLAKHSVVQQSSNNATLHNIMSYLFFLFAIIAIGVYFIFRVDIFNQKKRKMYKEYALNKEELKGLSSTMKRQPSEIDFGVSLHDYPH